MDTRAILPEQAFGEERKRGAVEVKLEKFRRKISVKFHIVAVLDYNIILAAKIMSQRLVTRPL